jgi:hypothetical protein
MQRQSKIHPLFLNAGWQKVVDTKKPDKLLINLSGLYNHRQ